MAEIWTHGRWLVRPGKEDELVAAWRDLAEWSAESRELLEAFEPHALVRIAAVGSW